ncbi:putative prophage-related protein [Halobacteriovorax marinus SJ]|uniref:Prophage-related protein n=1 Tax=Halobacteriovorax marinus (strain ATCC BAA-682 / DSM 15412 / SJ) TaxID=862908 RepID=E1X5U6_HALMS|nr:helix-turn-helix transcriptional regulator [Halobacteriovorax marinus]CBW25663.1 putative prophage-related protein [Halobacteriovorax marinus SJ]
MNDDELKIGKVLTALMKKKGITFNKLSDATGVSSSNLKSWSANANPKSWTQLKVVADFFGVDIEYLLFGKSNNELINLEDILTEKIFEGWVKISVEKIASGRPIVKKPSFEDE